LAERSHFMSSGEKAPVALSVPAHIVRVASSSSLLVPRKQSNIPSVVNDKTDAEEEALLEELRELRASEKQALNLLKSERNGDKALTPVQLEDMKSSLLNGLNSRITKRGSKSLVSNSAVRSVRGDHTSEGSLSDLRESHRSHKHDEGDIVSSANNSPSGQEDNHSLPGEVFVPDLDKEVALKAAVPLSPQVLGNGCSSSNGSPTRKALKPQERTTTHHNNSNDHNHNQNQNQSHQLLPRQQDGDGYFRHVERTASVKGSLFQHRMFKDGTNKQEDERQKGGVKNLFGVRKNQPQGATQVDAHFKYLLQETPNETDDQTADGTEASDPNYRVSTVSYAPKGALANMSLKQRNHLAAICGAYRDPPVKSQEEVMEEVEAQVEGFRLLIANQNKCTLSTTSKFIRAWDFVMLLLLIFTATFTPYDVAFLQYTSTNSVAIVNYCVDSLFLIDIFVSFLTIYQDSGKWVYDTRKIAKRYFSTFFWVDFISVLPFNLIAESIQVSDADVQKLQIFRFLKLLKFTRLVRLVRGHRLVVKLETEVGINYGRLSLLKFGVSTLLLAHWGACLWGIDWTSTEKSWKTERNLDLHREPFQVYVLALYWSTMTVTTIGYGDVSPENDAERAVAIALMFVGGAVYAYTVGSICRLIAAMSEEEDKFNQIMDHLNSYMKVMSMDKTEQGKLLSVKLRKFFLQSNKNRQSEKNRQGIIGLMSPGLQDDFIVQCHQAWVARINVFQTTEDEQTPFLIKITPFLQFEAFPPGEVVYSRGEFTDKMYIIRSGLAVCEGRIISAPKAFGEDIILLQNEFARRHNTVLTLTHIDVLSLHKEDLREILESEELVDTCKKIRK